MKKYLLVVLSVFMLSGLASAEEVLRETSKSLWHKHEYLDKDTDTDTDSYADRDRLSYGVGVNAIVLETDLWFFEKERVEYKYNINYDEHSVFAMTDINLPKLFGKKGE